MKNIFFFLTPKYEIACMMQNQTIFEALEKMNQNGYTTIPIIDENGKYICSITKEELQEKFNSIKERREYEPNTIMIEDIIDLPSDNTVHIYATIEDLKELLMSQSVVPVLDDIGVFIGWVTRKTMMSYSMGY